MIEVRRSADRFTTTTGWLTSRHSFSFGAHYDPGNVGFADLVAHNDDVVAVGHGYDTHPHVDTEVVTWVLEGSLVHQDSHGVAGRVDAGQVQRMSAGRGVLHSERNDSPGADRPTRFVQMWLRPDESGLEPSYAQAEAARGALTPLVSGDPTVDAAVRIHTSGAVLHLARPAPGQRLVLPDAPHLHVFAARGTVDLEGVGRLEEGDAARLSDEGGPALRGVTESEVLVWQLRGPARRG